MALIWLQAVSLQPVEVCLAANCLRPCAVGTPGLHVGDAYLAVLSPPVQVARGYQMLLPTTSVGLDLPGALEQISDLLIIVVLRHITILRGDASQFSRRPGRLWTMPEGSSPPLLR